MDIIPAIVEYTVPPILVVDVSNATSSLTRGKSWHMTMSAQLNMLNVNCNNVMLTFKFFQSGV